MPSITTALPALLALAVLAGCSAQATATADVPDRITFASAAPGDGMAVKARKALVRMPPDGSNDRTYGIVLGVTPRDRWYARVLTRRGVVILEHGWNCDVFRDNDAWRLLAQPGDMVAWTGRNTELCPSEFGVAEVGTVTP